MEELKRLLGFHVGNLILSLDCGGWFQLSFEDSYITEDRIKYEGVYGTGKTVEEAAKDYIGKLRGKRLIIHPKCTNEREFYFL